MRLKISYARENAHDWDHRCGGPLEALERTSEEKNGTEPQKEAVSSSAPPEAGPSLSRTVSLYTCCPGTPGQERKTLSVFSQVRLPFKIWQTVDVDVLYLQFGWSFSSLQQDSRLQHA